MKKLLAVALSLLLASPAYAQDSKATLNTTINTNWPDNTSGAITPALLRSTVAAIVSSYVDWLTCTAQGGILYWGAGGVPSCLTANTAGYILKTQGAAANPTWQANDASMLTMSTAQRFLGNNAAVAATAQELSANTLFDWIGSTRGSVFYRGASGWAVLAPSTSGYLLKTQDSGADPAYQANTAAALTVAANQRFIGNSAGASQAAQELSASTLLDWISATQGQIPYRGASSWTTLTAGTTGYVLQSTGAGSNPQWAAVTGTGTVTSIICGLGLTCSSNPITAAGTITPTVATFAETWSGTAYKLIDATTLRGAGQMVALASATPTIAVNFSVGVNFALSLTGSVQLGNPSAMTPGATGCIFISKDLTSRTLSYNSFWKFAGGTAPVLSTTTTTVPDVLCYLVYTSSFVWGTMTKAIN